MLCIFFLTLNDVNSYVVSHCWNLSFTIFCLTYLSLLHTVLNRHQTPLIPFRTISLFKYPSVNPLPLIDFRCPSFPITSVLTESSTSNLSPFTSSCLPLQSPSLPWDLSVPGFGCLLLQGLWQLHLNNKNYFPGTPWKIKFVSSSRETSWSLRNADT